MLFSLSLYIYIYVVLQILGWVIGIWRGRERYYGSWEMNTLKLRAVFIYHTTEAKKCKYSHVTKLLNVSIIISQWCTSTNYDIIGQRNVFRWSEIATDLTMFAVYIFLFLFFFFCCSVRSTLFQIAICKWRDLKKNGRKWASGGGLKLVLSIHWVAPLVYLLQPYNVYFIDNVI